MRINIREPHKFSLPTYKDQRGYLIEFSKSDHFIKNQKLNYEIYTYSNGMVFRGLHFQLPPKDQNKLLILKMGNIKDYLIDLRKGINFGKKKIFNLKQGDCLWIPKGFAHGFKTKSENTILSYKLSSKFNEKYYRSLSYKSVGIKIDNYKISQKDSDTYLNLNDLKGIF